MEYVSKEEVLDIGHHYYLNTLNLSAMGFIQLRDETWVKAGLAVPHYLGGMVKKSDTAAPCGVVDGVTQYALITEVTGDWRLCGDDLDKRLSVPGITDIHDGLETIVEWVTKVIHIRRNTGRDNVWNLLNALLGIDYDSLLTHVIWDIFNDVWNIERTEAAE
jgi:hypothetical protein